MRNEGGGFAANIYGAMPEGLLIAGFPRIVSLPQWGRLRGAALCADFFVNGDARRLVDRSQMSPDPRPYFTYLASSSTVTSFRKP